LTLAPVQQLSPRTLKTMARHAGFVFFCIAAIALAAGDTAAEEPSSAAAAAFNAYIAQVESRIASQHQSASTFLAPVARDRLRRGEFLIEKLTPDPAPSMPGAMLHHWRGGAFVAGATAVGFERVMRNFSAYPQIFAPQILKAGVTAQQGNRYQVSMRLRQVHVITVVLDTTYDVTFSSLDPMHGDSASRSTRISEIKSSGTPGERALSPAEEHGFLWRLNTYWSVEERDGGLYMQIESVSLTRSIPTGLAWAIRPFVESVPRESLEFTLHASCAALGKNRK
jgi:hypothetical protein